MTDCQPNIEIHKTTGSTQGNRMLKALSTDFVSIDERKVKDLIMATHALSKNINFYGDDNQVVGKWSAFFEWESTSILAQLASLNIEKYLADYKLKKRKLLFIPSLVEQQNEIQPFFEELENTIKDLYRKIEYFPEVISIKEYFMTTFPTIDGLLSLIINEIDASIDLQFLLQHHLFNKKIQNLFGLLSDWKNKSNSQLYLNISSYSKHSPQYSLYLTFLKLFENAQADLNTYTKRHLDFYYKEVLHLAPKPATPDYVHCYVESHKNESPFSLEKGSPFIAGKNSEGLNKYYITTADSTINQAKIGSIYGAFKSNEKYSFSDLIDKNASGESWPAFTQTEEIEQIGLLIASPLLFLQGGVRTVRLSFKKNDSVIEIDPQLYDFYLSGEKGWLLLPSSTFEDGQLPLIISPEDPAIVPYDPEIHDGVTLHTLFPVLKIVDKDGHLVDEGILGVSLEVEVLNYKQFNLYSNTGLLDHTKPFEPFGSVPKTGLGVIFSCNEFFQKKNATGYFDIETEEEPVVRPARQGRNPITDELVEIDATTILSPWDLSQNTELQHLDGGVWVKETDWSNKEKKYNITNLSEINHDFDDNKELTPSDNTGFFKIVLTNSDYYGQSYLENFIDQSKEEDPKLPYIPTINTISFNYIASSDENPIVDCYQLYSRGYKKVTNGSFRIVPQIINNGELFIGFTDVKPGNSISLLFQVAKGTANPRQLPAEIQWKYLYQNNWKNFDDKPVTDESNGLTQSGIVEIQVPELLDFQAQTIFPSDQWWIKIEVPKRVDAVCQLVGIHAQALKAVLHDYEGTGMVFEENLEAKTISKLLRPKNQIKKIEQPYVSYGGEVAQTDQAFHIDISERCRHKDKSITTWDYEKLVLDNFREVFRVKCLNHYRYDATEINNSSAGYVTIIPVARGLENNVPNYWKPIVDLGTMKRIKTFLKSKASPHVRLNVKPPNLEQLELMFNVKYKEIPGADSRLYDQQLKDAINVYLSPWAYQSDDSISFQSAIEKSALVHLIEQQSYVDYISEFKVNHLILAETSDDISTRMDNVDKIIPKTVYSLFVPYDHKITSITNLCCS